MRDRCNFRHSTGMSARPPLAEGKQSSRGHRKRTRTESAGTQQIASLRPVQAKPLIHKVLVAVSTSSFTLGQNILWGAGVARSGIFIPFSLGAPG